MELLWEKESILTLHYIDVDLGSRLLAKNETSGFKKGSEKLVIDGNLLKISHIYYYFKN